MTVAEFARRIEMSRENAYDIFKRKDIDTGLIRTVSKVLGHDFLGESLGLTKSKKIPEPNAELKHQMDILQMEVGKVYDRLLNLEKLVKHKRE